jgi:preprotein translocase subunit SecE
MRVAKTASTRKQIGIVRYFRETIGELRKVSWPTRNEATRLTIIVLVVITITSLFLGLMDFLFSRLFALFISLG